MRSLDEVDPELLRTFDRLGIPLAEQKRLTNVAVDAVFDSVSIATTFKKELSEHGIIFMSISEAVHTYPELVRKHLGSVVRCLLCIFTYSLLSKGVIVLCIVCMRYLAPQLVREFQDTGSAVRCMFCGLCCGTDKLCGVCLSDCIRGMGFSGAQQGGVLPGVVTGFAGACLGLVQVRIRSWDGKDLAVKVRGVFMFT